MDTTRIEDTFLDEVKNGLRKNNTGPLREYISAGLDVNYFYVPLYVYKAVVSDIELVEILFGLGMQIKYGWSFFKECDGMSDEVFDYALARGLDKTEAIDPHIYSVMDNPRRSEELIKRGADMYADVGGKYILAVAAEKNKHATVRYWVGRGFNVNHQPESGYTAFQYAAMSGECGTDMFDLLVELGADITHKEYRGRNAAALVAESNQPGPVALRKLEWLSVEIPALINEADRDGLTALHCAVIRGNKQVVEFLAARADILAKDAKGRTALDLCIEDDNAGCFEVIFFRQRDIGEMSTDEEARLWSACDKFGAEKIKQFMLQNQMGSIFM